VPLLVWSAGSIVQAQTPDLNSLADRLKKLESEMSQLKQENQTLRKQLGFDAKGVAPATVTAGGKEQKLSIGGFFQINGEFGEAPDSRFPAEDRILMRRARLGVKGSFAEDFSFLLQADFGNNAVGGTNGYRGQITDGYVTWTKYSAANVTIGQFKTPFGYEQLLADPKTVTVERSLPNDKLTLSRQIGAMVSGSFAGDRLTYSAGLFNGNGVNNGANDNDQFLYVGRVTGTVVQSGQGRLGVGVDGFSSRDTGTFTGRHTGAGVDIQASFGPAEVQAEYLRGHFDRDTGADYGTDGWSVLGTYMLVPKTLQAVLRYETYDPNRAVGGDDGNLWTVGFNYLIKGDDLKLSVDYLLGDPAGPLARQQRLLTRMQLVF
jgi:phosphate-selective porin